MGVLCPFGAFVFKADKLTEDSEKLLFLKLR